jgi:endonuclease-3
MISRPSKILKVLKELYPNAESELNFSNEFELLVAVVLSAQCTDKKVNDVTPELFSRYPTPLKLSRARVTTIEGIIREVNYYKTKSKNIVGLSKELVSKYSEMVPRTHQALISLPGVGNKTANVVLSELGITPTIPVDTHVKRVSFRLALSSGKTPEKVEEDLEKLYPPEEWRDLHHSLIFHGRRVCKAQRPLCKDCKLRKLCDFPEKNPAQRG